MDIPQTVTQLLYTLGAAGHSAYLVGGCVRDLYMGRTPADWDVASSARPEQVMSLFPHCYPLGVRFGTVGVVTDSGAVEVTTYRTEDGYEDHRHPTRVAFADHIRDDLARRDFTVNALALSADGQLLDYFGGLNDIQNKIIRCVGNPMERFREDALRMYRALRFGAVLGFRITNETVAAITTLAEDSVHIAPERISTELAKTLCSPNPSTLALLFQTGLHAYFLPPPWHDHPEIDVLRVILDALNILPADYGYRLGGFISIIGKNILNETDVVSILDWLRVSNDVRTHAIQFVHAFSAPPPTNRREIASLLKICSAEVLTLALELKTKAYALSHCTKYSASILLKDCTAELAYLKAEMAKGGLRREDLAIKGADLRQLGIPQGRTVGQTLEQLFSLILTNPTLNQKEFLLEQAKKIIKGNNSA